MQITFDTIRFDADNGKTIEIKTFSRNLEPEDHIIVLMPGWGCGEAGEYLPFIRSLLIGFARATVLVPEFNKTTPQLTPIELGNRFSYPNLHATQKQKQFVCEQLLGWAVRKYHPAKTFTVIGYSEGAIHAILAAQKHRHVRQLELVLANPAGLAARAQIPMIFLRALRNSLHNLYARISNDSATRSRLAQHRLSVRRYLKEYQGSGTAEGINAGQIDLRVEAETWATFQDTKIHLITSQDDAMIDLTPLQNLVQRSPNSFDLKVIKGIHSTLFTHPYSITEVLPK